MVKPDSNSGAIVNLTMRDCITQAAADSEVLLHIATGSDQASDDQSLVGREEALRLDEEIMDFQWFNTQHGDMGQHQGPSGHHVCSATANFQVCSATSSARNPPCHHAPRSLLSSIGTSMESSWLSIWLLLGRAAVNSSKSNCAHSHSGRKNGQPSAPWYVQSVTMLLSLVQHAELQQMKSSHASAKRPRWLGQVSEVARWPQPRTHHQHQSLSRLYKRSKVFTPQTRILPFLLKR